MKTLIQSALVIDPQSSHHGKRRDILIEDRQIIKIGQNLTANKANVISGKGLCVSPGWVDLMANFGDPGFEYCENFESGAEAARKGGFGTVVLLPSTLPVVDSKGAVEYVQSKTKDFKLRIFTMGTLSDKIEGKQLSEMYDMHAAGAIAFSDDKKNVSTELMSRAMEYARNFNGLLYSFPYDAGLSAHGQMNEGPVSVSLGMKGIPNVSEELRIQRDLELLRYNGGRLHFSLISTAKGVDLIRKAKKEGLNITCAVAAHQLVFLDDDLKTFDSNYKVLPPFRTKEDRKALIAGLKDGTIDAICSDHSPVDVEHKVREFEDALFGMSSIQTAFAMAYSALEKSLSVEEIIAKFVEGPKRILSMENQGIEENQQADLTVFSIDESTLYCQSNWSSRSRNNPLIGKELKGRIYPI